MARAERAGDGTLAAADSAARERSLRVRHVLVLALAVNSGATDAIGFVGLGGVFTSVMTGNMVLLGVAAGRLDGTLAIHSAVAIASFVLGCALGSRIAGVPRRDDAVWPTAVTYALVVEFVAFAAFAVGWELVDDRTDTAVQLVFLGLNAVALGIQSSAILRFGVSGLSTTYLTGTLTTVVVSLVSRRRLIGVGTGVQLLLALIGGAAVGGALTANAPRTAPLLQLVTVGATLLVASRARSLRVRSPAARRD